MAALSAARSHLGGPLIAPKRKSFPGFSVALLATGCLVALGIPSRPLQAQPPKYRLADLEVKTLAAAPGRYFGRCALEQLADGKWFRVYHESGSHFRYEPAEPKPILSGVLHARFSADGGRAWSKEDHCLDDHTEDSGYGDMLYDGATKRYVAILYHGTVDESALKQYSFRVVKE